jgi:hypothetical protein
MSDRVPKILDAMDDEHRLWIALVGDLGEFEATRRAGTRWSPVDTLNHVTAWNMNALRVATSQATADAPPLNPSVGSATILGLDVDDHNAEILARRRDWSLAQTLAWAEEVHRDLRMAVEVLPSDRVVAPDGPHGIVGWLLLPAIEHPPEHRLRLERQLGYTP